MQKSRGYETVVAVNISTSDKCKRKCRSQEEKNCSDGNLKYCALHKELFKEEFG